MGVSKTAVVYVGASSLEPAFLDNVSIGFPQLEVGAATFVSLHFSSNSATDQPITLRVSPSPVASLTDANPVLPAGQNQVYIPLAAKAPGAAQVSATAGGVTLNATVTVLAQPTFSINLTSAIPVNGAVEGSIFVDCLLASDRSVSLSSSAPSVAAVSPPTVTISPGTQGVQFEVRGLSQGTADISYAPSPLPSPSPPPVHVTVN
jgi:hypothetical protein